MSELKKDLKIYFSVGAREYLYLLMICGVQNVLISYAYQEPFKCKDILKRHGIKVMCDSGAFSVWSRGHEVNLDAYIQFVKDNMEIIDPEMIVGLDVILGGRKTATQQQFDEACKKGMENYYYALDKGVKMMPVFHQGDNFIWLEKMCKECTRIGISPNNDFRDEVKGNWLRECFEIIAKLNPKLDTHAFGVTSYELLSKYPYSTADSSSWALTSSFGAILTPFGRVSISEERKDLPDFIDNIGEVKKKAIIEYIESFGFSYELCKKKYKYRNIINIFYFLNMQDKLNAQGVQLEKSTGRLFEPMKLHKDAYQKMLDKTLQNDIL